MQWKRFHQFKQNAARGASMPLVICAGTLLIAFSLAIVYTAGLMLGDANEKLSQERCYQLAKSFARTLDAQLTDTTDEGKDDELQTFINKFLADDAYLTYSSDNADATTYYFALGSSDTADTINGGYGNIRLQLRKETDDDDTISLSGTLDVPTNADASYTTKIENLETATFMPNVVMIDVIAEYDDLSYTYSLEYNRKDTYALTYTYGGQTIVWDGTNWHYGNTAGAQVTFSEDSADKIYYTYDTEQLKSWEFIPEHEERSDSP